jgi:hypothetical protein
VAGGDDGAQPESVAQRSLWTGKNECEERKLPPHAEIDLGSVGRHEAGIVRFNTECCVDAIKCDCDSGGLKARSKRKKTPLRPGGISGALGER